MTPNCADCMLPLASCLEFMFLSAYHAQAASMGCQGCIEEEQCCIPIRNGTMIQKETSRG